MSGEDSILKGDSFPGFSFSGHLNLNFKTKLRSTWPRYLPMPVSRGALEMAITVKMAKGLDEPLNPHFDTRIITNVYTIN